MSVGAKKNLISIMNDQGVDQLIHFPPREMITLDLLLTSLPSQFQDINFQDKLSDHDVIARTLKVKPRRKVYEYQKGDYESIKKRCIQIYRKKNMSMVIQILAWCKITSIVIHCLSRIQWMRTFHQKLVAPSAQFHG